MLRWAAGRYQLLVLSRHYLDSSKHVVQYLEKMEEKLSAAKDIPPTVLEKIKEESRKAKVRNGKKAKIYPRDETKILIVIGSESKRSVFSGIQVLFFSANQLPWVIFVWPRLSMKMAQELMTNRPRHEFPRHFRKQSRPNENNQKQLVGWEIMELENGVGTYEQSLELHIGIHTLHLIALVFLFIRQR